MRNIPLEALITKLLGKGDFKMILNKCFNCNKIIPREIDVCRECIKRVEILGTNKVVVRVNDLIDYKEVKS